MKNKDLKKLSTEIKIQLIQNDYSQKELAEKLNISENTISKWTSGIIPNKNYLEFLKMLDIDIYKYIV